MTRASRTHQVREPHGAMRLPTQMISHACSATTCTHTSNHLLCRRRPVDVGGRSLQLPESETRSRHGAYGSLAWHGCRAGPWVTPGRVPTSSARSNPPPRGQAAATAASPPAAAAASSSDSSGPCGSGSCCQPNHRHRRQRGQHQRGHRQRRHRATATRPPGCVLPQPRVRRRRTAALPPANWRRRPQGIVIGANATATIAAATIAAATTLATSADAHYLRRPVRRRSVDLSPLCSAAAGSLQRPETVALAGGGCCRMIMKYDMAMEPQACFAKATLHKFSRAEIL